MPHVFTTEETSRGARAGQAAAAKCGARHELTCDDAEKGSRVGGAAVAAIPGHMATIGRLGGLACTHEQQAERGAKGGATTVARHGREHMAEIGRRGREARKAKKESGR